MSGACRAGPPGARMAEHRLARLIRPAGRAAAPPIAGAFRLLFEAAAEGLALLDDQGRVVLANAALGRMAGPGVVLAPGLPVERLVAPAAREALLEHLRAGGIAPFHAAPADPAAAPDAE